MMEKWILLLCTLLGCVGSVQYWQQEHPGKDKRHHYRLAQRHSGGFSDEWLGSCQYRYILDYDQVPIRDPDPRLEDQSGMDKPVVVEEDGKRKGWKDDVKIATNNDEKPIEHEGEKERPSEAAAEQRRSRNRNRKKRNLVGRETAMETGTETWESQTWFKESKALPFHPRGGDKAGLKVLIVTVDNRALKNKRRDKDTESIDNTAIINERYAAKHGYDYLYIKTSEPGGGKSSANDSVCAITKERFNCSSFLKLQCPQGGRKGKYEIATYHVGRGYGRASSWNKLPPLIYLSSEFGHKYDYFLFLDSDVMLNARYHYQSLSNKLDNWQDGKSNISPQIDNLVWGQKTVRDAEMIALTNYPWRDDLPCAGIFMFKPHKVGIEMLMEWWDYDIPLKNLFDFMEQDALWYMLEHDTKFKINSTSMSFVYEGQFLSRNTGVTQLFFVHMANYVEQKQQYVSVMFQELIKQAQKEESRDEEKSDGNQGGGEDFLSRSMEQILRKRYLLLDTIGLCEYADVTRRKMGIALRDSSYFPNTINGRADEEWHAQERSKIIPHGQREKYYPPIGRLYNGYALGFSGMRSLFYVINDTIHEFPNWNTFVAMGFDLDHTLHFRDFGRGKPCQEKFIEVGWPILDIAEQKEGASFLNFQAEYNGSLMEYHQ